MSYPSASQLWEFWLSSLLYIYIANKYHIYNKNLYSYIKSTKIKTIDYIILR